MSDSDCMHDFGGDGSCIRCGAGAAERQRRSPMSDGVRLALEAGANERTEGSNMRFVAGRIEAHPKTVARFRVKLLAALRALPDGLTIRELRDEIKQ
jgi:hypothetical protein